MFSFLITLCGLVCAVCAQENWRDKARAALQNPDLFEGDMLGVDVDERNAISWTKYRWPGGRVPYELDYSVSGYTNLIKSAFSHYQQNTCVRFVQRTNEQNYIRIFAGQGCYSMVGMMGGKQLLSLGEGCYYPGTVVHELGHALGFFHEHSRSDRDDYLYIYLQNVQQGMESNFRKLRPVDNILYTPFDYDSIMIYDEYSFSKDGRSMTMKPKNGYKLTNAYDKKGMDRSDIARVNAMYCS